MLALQMDTDSTTNAVKEEPVYETDNSYGLKITNVVSLARYIYSIHDILVGLIVKWRSVCVTAKADCRFCAFTCAQ